MEIKDKIYGKEVIEEEVLIDLINSDTLKRLKKISQFGLPDEYYHKKGFTRYEHSIGVLILLRRLGASLEEQIAGLLHDVSHTAFSHLVDWVMGDRDEEDYQDNVFVEFLSDSEIPEILEKHGFDPKEFFEIKNFSLLEKEAPSLCADRVDYALRELSLSDIDKAKELFNYVKNKDGNIVFNSKEKAEIFAKEYQKLQREHWGAPEAKARWYFMSWILRKALHKNLIDKKDFYKTDEEVIKILRNDKSLSEELEWLKNNFEIKITEKEEGIHLPKKFRHIDPEVLTEERIVPLSQLSQEYRAFLENEKSNSNKTKGILFLRDS